MKAIKESGAKYVVMVAKHHDGLCLWPTKQTDYSIRQSPWKDGQGDIVAEVVKAARANGLKFGVYLSPWDRHEPKYKDPPVYDAYYNAQLEELASHYGDLVELWLDGVGSAGRTYYFAKIIQTLRTYQPNTIVFADTGLFEYGDALWAGDESGKIEYQNWNVIDRHGYLRWRPVEVDTPLRKLHGFCHCLMALSDGAIDQDILRTSIVRLPIRLLQILNSHREQSVQHALEHIRGSTQPTERCEPSEGVRLKSEMAMPQIETHK